MLNILRRDIILRLSRDLVGRQVDHLHGQLLLPALKQFQHNQNRHCKKMPHQNGISCMHLRQTRSLTADCPQVRSLRLQSRPNPYQHSRNHLPSMIMTPTFGSKTPLSSQKAHRPRRYLQTSSSRFVSITTWCLCEDRALTFPKIALALRATKIRTLLIEGSCELEDNQMRMRSISLLPFTFHIPSPWKKSNNSTCQREDNSSAVPRLRWVVLYPLPPRPTTM